MSDHAKNGAIRHTEFDAVADLRKEIDQDITSIDRRMGIVESVLTTRVDMIDVKLGHVLEAIKSTNSEMSEIRQLLSRVLGGEQAAAEPKPRAPKKRK